MSSVGQKRSRRDPEVVCIEPSPTSMEDLVREADLTRFKLAQMQEQLGVFDLVVSRIKSQLAEINRLEKDPAYPILSKQLSIKRADTIKALRVVKSLSMQGVRLIYKVVFEEKASSSLQHTLSEEEIHTVNFIIDTL